LNVLQTAPQFVAFFKRLILKTKLK
jgi:hypothetical protein